MHKQQRAQAEQQQNYNPANNLTKDPIKKEDYIDYEEIKS